MLASLLVLLAMLTVRSRFDDPDLWWHLKTGQIIWTTHAIPLTDLFSYTTNHQSLIPQEWLAQVAIYAAYSFGGYSGLMLWLCVFSSLLVVAGYCLCWLYSGNAKVAFAGALAIWLFATIGFAIRPQMIAYVLLIAELIVIHLGRTRNARWFFWLPVLFAIWINCHGSFILGIIVAAVLLASSILNFQMGSLLTRRWDPNSRKMLAWALALSVAALFLNPIGIKQIFYPFDTMLNMHVLLGNVEEWAPLELTDARGIGLMCIVLVSFLLVIVRRSELFFDELLLMAIGTWLAVSHERMLVVFGILVAPVLSRQLSTLWEGYDSEKDRIWPNALLIGMSLMVVVLAFPNGQNLEEQVATESPVRAVDFIKANHLSGPMLNDYQSGGYLIWAAPEYPVMMDGRTDVYEWSGFLSEFGNWATLQSDPTVLLRNYKVSFCLLTPNSPMAHVLPLMPEWKTAYKDDNAVIFVRTQPETAQSR